MNFFPNNMVGLDFQDHWIELVQIKKQGKTLVLEAFSRKTIPPGIIQNGEVKNKEELGNLVLDALRSANPQPISSKQVSVMLPARAVFAHIFKLPAKLSPKEVRQTIGYEAENTIPFQLSELYFDHRILERGDPKNKDAFQYILFAAIPKSSADEYARVFETLGLQVQMFGISIDTVIHALQRQLQEDHENIVVEFGPLSTTSLFLKGTTLKAFTSSNEGYEKFIGNLQSKYGIDDAAVHQKWENNTLSADEIEELKTFIKKHYKIVAAAAQENIEKKSISVPTDLYLTGEYAALPVFYELAQEYFPDLKIHIGDPKSNLVVDDKKFSQKQLEQGGKVPLAVYFSNSIGIVMATLKTAKIQPVNLLPERLKMRVRRKHWNFFETAAAALITLISLGISGFLFAQHQSLNFSRTQLESSRQQIQNTLYGTRYQEIQSLFTAFNAELTELSRVEAALFSVPKVLTTIVDRLPPAIALTGIVFNDASLTVQITGVANTREALLEYQQNLKEIEYVSDVTLPLSNFNEKTQISFTITASFQFAKLPRYGEKTN